MQTTLTRKFQFALLILALVPLSAYAQRDPPVERFTLESKLLGRAIDYSILYPVNYQRPANAEKKFPVIYLLHGITGHHTNWLERTRIALYATHYDLFVVMVEGENGWYSDSATVPTDKFESYILQELMPDVEKRFRVSTEREGRAIAGLSMGGYGSLKFGFKFPEKFALVGSMSGALKAASWTDAELKDFEFIRQSLLKTYGPVGSKSRAENDLVKLTQEVSVEGIKALPTIYLDCGTEDPLFSVNRAYADLLVQRKIPHEFRELPGSHTWQYWDQQVREILNLAAQRLAPPK
ncbi:MAG TPA: alpha/beta hydrolase family protein [Pyrinomonadaceae bacterium]|nr:alpha/beta hydrolase family protein [Pyrinomonadaceae bacterium]